MIYIRKKGIFYENNYRPEAEEYILTRVESFIPYLTEPIQIEDGVTLEDLFLILEKDEELVNLVFGSHMGHFSIRPFIDEIKRDCLPESREELEYIECNWVAEQFDYKKFYEKFKDDFKEDNILGPLKKPNDDRINEISIYIDIHGWGKYKQEENEIYEEGEEIPTHMSYAIEFTPLYRIKHLPIKLNKNFVIKSEKHDSDEYIIINGEKEFTVFEVIGEILSEITFSGSPEDRDEQWKRVVDSVEEYEKEIEEGEDNE